MSRKLKISKLTDKQLQKFSKELEVEKEVSKYAFSQTPERMTLYDVDGDDLYIPFAYDINLDRPERKELSPLLKLKFHGELRENQKDVKNEVINHLNQTGSAIVAAACAFGKTCTSINIALHLKLKTLTVCHRIVLINQWVKSIKKFCPDAKTIVITSKTKKEDIHKADFGVINACNIRKLPRDFFSLFGFIIVDELHKIMAEKLSKGLSWLVPRYVLGLSATPYRNDGLDILIDMYFGKEKIVRKLFRKHTVYKIETGMVPETTIGKNGKIEWGSVLKSQSEDEDRNEMIINLVKYFSDRTILVMCKRVEQAKYLVKRLKEEKEDVTSLIGSNQHYEQESRILVGTTQKIDCGFDHPLMNTLILASDVEGYWEQCLGRVFRREDTEPVIFDIVDKHPILEKHFRTRTDIYTSTGGTLKWFRKAFPDFK